MALNSSFVFIKFDRLVLEASRNCCQVQDSHLAVVSREEIEDGHNLAARQISEEILVKQILLF